MDTSTSPTDHGVAFLQSTIGKHPVATAAVIGVLVVLILVLAFYLSKFKTKADACDATTSKSGLVVGNHSNWHYGSMDAAGTGSLARDTTKYQASVYTNLQKAGSGCSAPWDTDASVEAEALTSVGALQADNYDNALSMSDDQLQQLMHQGGTP